MISKTKKAPVSKNFNPGPGQYNVYTTVDDSGPKYTYIFCKIVKRNFIFLQKASGQV